MSKPPPQNLRYHATIEFGEIELMAKTFKAIAYGKPLPAFTEKDRETFTLKWLQFEQALARRATVAT